MTLFGYTREEVKANFPGCLAELEFKLRGTSEETLAQIEEKGYADRFATDPRKLFKIGCAFDWDARNLGRWLVA